MNTQDETHDTVQTTTYNPFPEPQTIPSGWDLSELTATPDADSDKDESTAS